MIGKTLTIVALATFHTFATTTCSAFSPPSAYQQCRQRQCPNVSCANRYIHTGTSTGTGNVVLASASSGTDMQTQGNEIIRKVAVEAGAQPDNIDIEWSGDRVVVTISGDLIQLQSIHEEVNEDDIDDDELDMYFDVEELEEGADSSGVFGDVDIDYYVQDELEDGEEKDDDDDNEPTITGIARAINRALAEMGEGSIGDQIAIAHSIEVTTPGASDVLRGDVMFEAYKGFEVIVETSDTNKKGKKKVVEGTLVEKTEDYTIVNIKGRMSKIKNEKVEVVRLPKAKKEKGAK